MCAPLLHGEQLLGISPGDEAGEVSCNFHCVGPRSVVVMGDAIGNVKVCIPITPVHMIVIGKSVIGYDGDLIVNIIVGITKKNIRDINKISRMVKNAISI